MTRKSTTKQLQFRYPAVFKTDLPPAVSHYLYDAGSIKKVSENQHFLRFYVCMKKAPPMNGGAFPIEGLRRSGN